jgi:hypothetical protein
MSEELVDVQIRVPKAMNAFVEKMAALEGSKATDFYENWIHMGFYSEVTESDDGLMGLNMPRVREHNQLNPILKDC